MYKGVYDYLCGKEPNSISIAASVIPDYAARSAAEKVGDSLCIIITIYAMHIYYIY